MIEPETASRIPNLRLVGVYAAGAGLWNVIADQLPALLSLDPAGSALVGTLKGWGLVAVTSLLLVLLLKPAPRRQVPATAPTIASAAPCRPGLRWVHCLAPSLFVVLIGVSVYAVVANSIRQTENERLGAIAAFKKDQIESWLAERRGDILVAGNGPFFIDALAKYLARPDETLRSQLALRMDVSMKAYGYAGAKVLGLDGRVIVRTGDADQDDRDLQAAARQALGQSEPVLLDLHRAAPAEPIRLALVAPIRDARLPERPAIGVVALSIDPTRNLFPMLGSWPTATTSGETLIVRRDGNDALFLSPLRHRTDAPMTLRIPLSRMDVPAIQGLTLGAGIYHGVDYREQSVLTAIRPIAGTPWMLVAKIDQQEVYSGVRTAAGVCAALVLAGLTVIGLFLVMAWRQQRLRDLLVQGELGDRLAKVATSVPGLIYSFRLHPDGRTSMPIAGPALSDLCGLAPDDVAEDAGPIFSRMPPEDAERVMVSVTESARTLTPWRDDFRFRHPNKGERRIEGHAVPKREPDGSILWHGYLHDVTGRKQTEVALAKANRLLRTRSASTVALLNANDERSYLETVCQNVVAICGHTMVWVGYAEPDGARRVLPMATAGLDHGYLERAAITWADDEHGCGPTGTAIRTREAVVCQDMDGDNRLQPWRDDALQRGYHSSIALPLIAGAEVLGALTIYSAERAAFPDEDIDLLREVATDVADGISTLRLRIAHNRIERALRESEMKLRLFIEHAPAALAMFDTAMRYLFASRRWLSDYHLDLQDIVGKSHYEVFPEIPERWKEIHRRCLAGASETCDEDAFHRLDGRTDWLRWAIHPWYKDSGELGGIVTMSEHITEQVETRQALRKLSLAVDQSPTSIIITDLDHRIDYVNEAFTRITGYSREETLGRNPNFRASGRTPTETYRQLASALKQGEPWRGEFHNRRKTGEDCLELALVSPIRQHDGAITSYLSI